MSLKTDFKMGKVGELIHQIEEVPVTNQEQIKTQTFRKISYSKIRAGNTEKKPRAFHKNSKQSIKM